VGPEFPRTNLFKVFMFLTWCSNLVEFQNSCDFVVGLALVGKDIVFRFIIEYSSLSDFWPLVNTLTFYMRIFER
jgi:hypothetical protein